jgi:hypothetical protein
MTLLRELERLRAQHHYLDLSEQLRSIVRHKCLEHANPYTQELKRLRTDIERQAQNDEGKLAREQLIQDLVRMLREGRQ